MSYSIVYDQKVVKTPLGLNLIILAGDNNVYDAGGRRRSRGWYCVFRNQKAEDIINYYSSCCKGTSEHFMYRGKFLDDDGLMRWINNAIKKAKTIEEIVQLGHISGLDCKVEVLNKELSYGDSGYRKVELAETISTSDAYVAWSKEVENFLRNIPGNKIATVDCAFYGTEPLRLDRDLSSLPDNETCYIKSGRFYITQLYEDGSVHSGSGDFKAAKLFTYKEARELLEKHPYAFGKRLKVISKDSVEKKRTEEEYIVKLLDEFGNVMYVRKRTRRGFIPTQNISSARKYFLSVAKRVANELSQMNFENKYAYFVAKKDGERYV